MGVLSAAELGALAGRLTWMRSLDADVIRMARDEVDFPMQRRHPEGMDHIARFQLNGDGADSAGIWISLAVVNCCDRIVVQIMDLPPPLVAD